MNVEKANLKANITNYGQVFTPSSVVDSMLDLRRNFGRTLEPSSGTGAFLAKLEPNTVAVEIDQKLCHDNRVINRDFFAYSSREKFDTIVGNPPYVRFQDITETTKKLLTMQHFDRRSNLYLFFIDRCIDFLKDGGELIFITPRDFMKATSAKNLNTRLYEEGSFSHFFELGDTPIFKGATPNCAIWRWEKGRTERKIDTGLHFCSRAGQIWFGSRESNDLLGDEFEVRVGAVSGADDVFTSNKHGCTNMVCSSTIADGRTRRMIYNRNDNSLRMHKQRLLNRKVRKFDESNWWEWGRKFFDKEGPRIYVNAKTRRSEPFYVSEEKAYDGSVLALFPRVEMNLNQAAKKLNQVNWLRLGFVCDQRFLFTQRSLENAPVGAL